MHRAYTSTTSSHCCTTLAGGGSPSANGQSNTCGIHHCLDGVKCLQTATRNVVTRRLIDLDASFGHAISGVRRIARAHDGDYVLLLQHFHVVLDVVVSGRIHDEEAAISMLNHGRIGHHLFIRWRYVSKNWLVGVLHGRMDAEGHSGMARCCCIRCDCDLERKPGPGPWLP